MSVRQLVLLSLVLPLLAMACSGNSPTHTPAADLGATVEAAVVAALPTVKPTPTPDYDATVEASMAATIAARPTATPTPTATPVPTSTPTPVPTATPTATPTPTPQPTPTPTPTPDPVVELSEVVERVRASIVRIETSEGSGSGVIFETKGQTGAQTAYVITNQHVVEGETSVSVTVNDSANYRGTVLGADSVRDLAVVTICCGAFQALPFGDASSLRPGDEVVAIGYPLGLPGEATVTRGIVSAVRYVAEYLSQVIQTDAAINPGNSGGPMLSTMGEIVGINTFKIAETSVEGVGFAISEETVQQHIPALQVAPLNPTPTPTPVPLPTGGFGPIDGELQHDPSDGFIKTEYADVSIADMMVEATFINPYSASSNDWDYGFMLRRSDYTGRQIQIVVSSDRRWYAAWREASDADNQRLGGGTLKTFGAGAGGRNHLRVVAIGDRGWFFVNGLFVTSLDLSDVTGAGDVAVITGAFAGDEVAGAATRFENFRGERLDRRYGPADGQFEYQEGFISTHDSGVQSRDVVAEAEFVSPSGRDWDYGFIVRNPEFNRLEVIGLTGEAWWFHQTRDVDYEDYSEVADGFLSSSGISLSSRNSLLVMAFEESGWFFVNDSLVAKLDLGHNLDSGDVSAMGGFFNNHIGEPSFENFKVWVP